MSAATGAAIEGNLVSTDTDLAEVIDAWPTLPKAMRQQVMALIRKPIKRQTRLEKR